MTGPSLSCRNEQRRHLVRQKQRNGLDYLEVSGNQLCVHFLGPVPQNLALANVQITGGQVIQDIQVMALELELQDDPTLDSCLRVYVDKTGDFSTYTLTIVALDAASRPTNRPHPDFDPRYSHLTFSFKVDCPNDLDCKTDTACPPEELGDETAAASINYLAKDYASFRQLILDRLALLMPDWTERHIPDLGITLVELLAYVGDYLSYYQDAVATEAYLGTARQRISVRRHARLVDYAMHEGCNARTWVHVTLDGNDHFSLPLEATYLITAIPNGPPAGEVLSPLDLSNLPASAYEVFEPMDKAPRTLYQSHNAMRLYTWGDRECCLPKGSTRATLIDGWRSPETPNTPSSPSDDDCNDEENPELPPWTGLERMLHLQPGDILIFEEVKGAYTGHPGDADPRRRHAVCLTKVTPTIDSLQTVQDVEGALPPEENVSPPMAAAGTAADPAETPATTEETASGTTEFGDLPIPLVEIEWSALDALPVAFCLSAIGPGPACELLTDITLVRGNVLLVDHGRTLRNEDLGTVQAKPDRVVCEAEGLPAPVPETPLPFRPQLQAGPLTFRQPPDLNDCSATRLLLQDPRQALPQLLRLTSQRVAAGSEASDGSDAPSEWTPVADLLASTESDRHVVAEIDDQGQAHLRFGSGGLGKLPAVDAQFTADYRVGTGPVGNVGAEAIAHLVLVDQTVSGIHLTPRNPLPAVGGTASET